MKRITLKTTAGKPVEAEVAPEGRLVSLAGKPVKSSRYLSSSNTMCITVEGYLSYLINANAYFQEVHNLNHVPQWAW